MTPEAIDEESDQILSAVKSEMEKNDWEGMQVSYDNAPVTTVASSEKSSTEDSGGGLSSGGIAGIILFVLVLVTVVGVLLIRYIRNKREDGDKEPLKQQLEAPFGNVDLESIQPRQDDPYESDSDSSGSSGSSNSGSSDSSTSSEEEEEEEEEDDVRSSSVISGDSFPSNVAQATPSVLEADYSSGEEDERSTNSTESEISSEVTKSKISSRGDDVDNQELQQSADNFGRQEVDNRDRRDGYPSQNTGIHDDNGDDDERSINSADPPGTSYRDLPQEYDWDSAMMAGVPPSHAHDRAMHNNPDAFTDEYFEESSQRFDVFESESQSSGQSGNSRHLFAPRIGHGLDGLFLGNRADQSQGSHGSQGSPGSQGSGSRRSVRPFVPVQGATNQHNGQYGDGDRFINHSNFNQGYDTESLGLRGLHPIRNDDSSHSRHSGHSQGESGPYMDNDQNFNDQNYMYANQDYNMDDNRDYMSDNGNISGYDHNQFNPPIYSMESGNNRSREYDTNSMPQMEGSTKLPPTNTTAYYDEQVFINDDFDSENYHYRQTSHRPEELDEISQTDTASTHQMSNSSSRAPAANNVGPNGELNEDSEESITNIFKSLSDIQTRLASKGKQQQSEQGAMLRRKTKKDSGHAYAPLSNQRPPYNASSGGAGGKEGSVDDGK